MAKVAGLTFMPDKIGRVEDDLPLKRPQLFKAGVHDAIDCNRIRSYAIRKRERETSVPRVYERQKGPPPPYCLFTLLSLSGHVRP